MKIFGFGVVVGLLVTLFSSSSLSAQESSVVGLRVDPMAGGSALTIELTAPASASGFLLDNPARLVVDVANARVALPRSNYVVGRGGIAGIRSSQFAPGTVRIVLDLDGPAAHTVEAIGNSAVVRLSTGAVAFESWTSGQPAAAMPAPAAPATLQVAPQPRITVTFQGVDIRDVLSSFAEFTGRSIVAGSEVSGSVNATIRDQPWDVALHTILRANGLVAQELASGIIQVDAMSQVLERRSQEALDTRSFRINYVPVVELQRSLEPLISQRGRLTANPSTNTLILTDTEDVLASVAAILSELDVRTPQVSIQAKIIFVNRTDVEELGITYDLKDSQGSSLNELVSVPDPVNPGQFTNTNIVALGGNSIAALGNANVRVQQPQLEAVLSLVLGRHTLISFIDALQSQELSDVQAAPLITMLDNHEAEIFVGDRTPIRVVDLGTPGGGAGGVGAPRATAELVETGIRLRVTPTITADRRILMQLHAERSSAQLAATDIGVNFQEQRGTTRLMVNDGETAVIGGLTVTEVASTTAGIPFLMDLPIIGSLFRTSRNREQKRDLLIMVTPRIIEDRA